MPIYPKRKDGRAGDHHLGVHPYFEEGNTVSAKHGAWSPRLVNETMAELKPELQAIIDGAPWIETIDQHGLLDYLRDMARLERLERWLADNGDRYPEDHKQAGELRDRDLREVASLRRRCMDHRTRLGLDPLSRSRLGLNVGKPSIDVARLWAQEQENP